MCGVLVNCKYRALVGGVFIGPGQGCWPALVGWRFFCVCAFGGFLLSFLIACAFLNIASLCSRARGLQVEDASAGPCGLKAELERLRGVLLMGSTAMQLWCGKVASRLNAGVRVTGGGDALSSSALLELEALLQKHLCDGSMLTLEQLLERCAAKIISFTPYC